MTYSFGKVAYEAYAKHTGNKTFDGREMPTWEDLPIHVASAWLAAAHGVIQEYSTDTIERLRHPLMTVNAPRPAADQVVVDEMRHVWESRADRENWPKNNVFADPGIDPRIRTFVPQQFTYWRNHPKPVIEQDRLAEVSRKIGDYVAAYIEAALITGKLPATLEAIDAKRKELTEELLQQAADQVKDAEAASAEVRLAEAEQQAKLRAWGLGMTFDAEAWRKKLDEELKKWPSPNDMQDSPTRWPKARAVDDFEAMARGKFQALPAHLYPKPTVTPPADPPLPTISEETLREVEQEFGLPDGYLSQDISMPRATITFTFGPLTDEEIRALKAERVVFGVDPGVPGGDVTGFRKLTEVDLPFMPDGSGWLDKWNADEYNKRFPDRGVDSDGFDIERAGDDCEPDENGHCGCVDREDCDDK